MSTLGTPRPGEPASWRIGGTGSNTQEGNDSSSRPPLLDSHQLLQGHRTVEILHNGERYRLQATRLGKLILTK